jgi:5-methylcytosine-specific restriction endonuclease McrA
MTAVPKPPFTLQQRQRLTTKYRGIPQPVKQAVFARDDLTCVWCLVRGGALDVHHKQRRSQGGPDAAWNLVSVHRICHRYIHEHPTEAKERGFLA